VNMKARIDYNRHDRQIWEEELDGFLPRRMFDAHAHLFWHTHLPAGHPKRKVWHDANRAAHLGWARRLYPGRGLHYLWIGTPVPGIDVERHNAFLAQELARDPKSRANFLITPACSPEYIAATAKQKGSVGLQPY